MIEVTNSATQFFEEDNDNTIAIYSAGNTGKWVGYYMNICNIPFFCYFDREINHEGAILNGRPIYNPQKLSEFAGKTLKIIVCPIYYKEVMADILWLEHKYGFNAVLLIPQYEDHVSGGERYNINKLLSYFRRKLYKGDIPTIISNDCTAGFMYEALGMVMASPTINTGFTSEDFIKLCKEPKKYLKDSIKDLHWEKRFDPRYKPVESLVGMLGDIRITFGHDSDKNKVISTWDMMKEYINWDRLVFVMQDAHYSISPKIVKEFDNLKDKHLFFCMRTNNGLASDNIFYVKENWLHSRECVIENNFDLLDWINKE